MCNTIVGAGAIGAGAIGAGAIGAGAIGAGAASRYGTGSGSDQSMRLLAAPALQHCCELLDLTFNFTPTSHSRVFRVTQTLRWLRANISNLRTAWSSEHRMIAIIALRHS
jgi:hypothetical protein